MKKFLLATLAVTVIIGMLVSSCGETAPAEAPEAPTPEEVAVPEVPEAPGAAPEAVAAPTGPKYGGTLKILSGRWGGSCFGWPIECSFATELVFEFVVGETLIRLYRDGTIEPFLATSWDLAPDLSSITFNLREGVRFHDGTDFNADAVKFIFDKNLEAGTSASINWESADIIDDYAVRLNFKKFDNALWTNLASMACAMVSPTAYRTKGVEWLKENPVGTGPFKFVEMKLDEYVKFEKNTDYWQEGKPYLDGYEVIFIADPVTLEMVFLAGGGHACAQQTAKVLSSMEARGYDVYAPYLGLSFFIPDNDPDSPFADKRVREALDYALDREAMAEAIGYGYYYPTGQMCFPGHPYYDPDIEWREYNPDEARRLLAEAGCETGLKTKLISFYMFESQTLLFQRALEEVGINAEIQKLAPQTWMGFWMGGWSSAVLASAHSIKPNWAAAFMGSFPPYGMTNASMIIPEGLVDLLDAAISTPDPDEMKELNQQIIKLLYDEAVLIVMCADTLGEVVLPKVKDGGWLWGVSPQSWRPDNAWLDE